MSGKYVSYVVVYGREQRGTLTPTRTLNEVHTAWLHIHFRQPNATHTTGSGTLALVSIYLQSYSIKRNAVTLKKNKVLHTYLLHPPHKYFTRGKPQILVLERSQPTDPLPLFLAGSLQ